MERAILHVDGDAFFAACEVARNPWLRGKPVVTGRERGIVCAATYEAKKLGVTRGMPIFKLKREFPEVIIFSGDYRMYGMYAERLYAIVRRYANTVEEYGIDECFGDLTGLDPGIAQKIQQDLTTELALSFSLGIASTKALAKLGSKWKKPGGLTFIGEDFKEFLARTPIEDVWGVGRALSVQLPVHNINTALDFIHRDRSWIEQKFSKVVAELHDELSGIPVWGVNDGPPEAPHSVQRTRSFTPATTDIRVLWAELSRNVEEACVSARREGLIPARASFFIKSQDFRYRGSEAKLPYPSDVPQDVLRALRKPFAEAYQQGVRYRATGTTLFAFRTEDSLQLDLWDKQQEVRKASRVFEAADRLAGRYGRQVVSLASSMRGGRGSRTQEEIEYQDRFRIKGTGAKRLPIPVLGEAT